MVFYRKYRPQTIEQLDSEVVKTALRNVLAAETIPHAFLFTGPKGLGKTSTARIVAKYVNCEAKTKKPCNKCASCVSITEGTNVDILEIDGASNRGIDEIRDLREKIRLLPVSAKKKVYIIDEVHMLTTEAFNALLKTLEEPPSHAMFVLCTTEPHKVPPTILSRCTHIHFKKATTIDLVHSFERILAGENITAEGNVLEHVASFADGSFRDGAKILEEVVVAAKGKKLTLAMVEGLYHATSIDAQRKAMLVSLQNNDKKKALEIVQQLLEQGVDIKYFLEQLLFYLHTLLLIKTGIIDEKESIVLDLPTIKQLVSLFSKAHGEIKAAVLPQLPLELAIVEWGGQEREAAVETKKQVQAKEEVLVSVSDTPAPAVTSALDSKALLHQLLDAIKGEHHMLAGVLRSCFIEQKGETLTIIAPSPFHQEKLSDRKTLDVLEKVCEDITGKKLTISVVLKGGE